MNILIPASVGELIDKITILQIKCANIADEAKLGLVREELSQLEDVRRDARLPEADISELEADLKAVNAELWDIEDAKRAAERAADFGPAFIANARAVYIKNDHRAHLKRLINARCGSTIVEVKSHNGL